MPINERRLSIVALAGAVAALLLLCTACSANSLRCRAGCEQTADMLPFPLIPPRIVGAAQTGKALRVTPGTWFGSPTRYTYLWQRGTAGRFTSISGATRASYTVRSADLGDVLRAVITARNEEGWSRSISPTTVAVTESPKGNNCFESPGLCGYPDPSTGQVGITDCSALTTLTSADQLPKGTYYYSGSGTVIDITADDVHLTDFNFAPGGWSFYLDGVSGTVFNDDCFAVDGASGQAPAAVAGGSNSSGTYASDTTVENSTLTGSGCPVAGAATTICYSSGVEGSLVSGLGNGSSILDNIMVGAVEDINSPGSGSRIAGNYVVSNGYEVGGHSEAIYAAQTSGLSIVNNTLFNPFDQSGVIFEDALGNACANRSVINGNLLAGAGFVLYECASAASAGTASLTFTNNDIARCAGGSLYDAAVGGHYCGGLPPTLTTGRSIGAGQDDSGYWPEGGFFGLVEDTYCDASTIWSGNIWNDSDSAVSCG